MQSNKPTVKVLPLTRDDLNNAEMAIVSYCQWERFQKEFSSLEKRPSLQRSSDIYRLDPVLQNGLLRVGGRLRKALMPEGIKHPIILSRINTKLHLFCITFTSNLDMLDVITCYLIFEKPIGSPEQTQPA